MKPSPASKPFWTAWVATLGATLFVVVLATLPPFLGETGRAVIMDAFAPFCHQLTAYSPHIAGVQLAVGHRIYGILWGLTFGTVAFLGLVRWDDFLNSRAAVVLGASAVPMTLDWTADAVGWWAKTPGSRFLTGTLFGIAAGYYLTRAVVQLFQGSRKNRATTAP